MWYYESEKLDLLYIHTLHSNLNTGSCVGNHDIKGILDLGESHGFSKGQNLCIYYNRRQNIYNEQNKSVHIANFHFLKNRFCLLICS